MENSTIKIEYKKFNSFLKDYIRMMHRNWLFMRINEEYPQGGTVNFELKVAELDKELKAIGIVVFSGVNDQGHQGVGFKFSFDDETLVYLNEKIPAGIKGKYGEFWGTRVCSYFSENKL